MGLKKRALRRRNGLAALRPVPLRPWLLRALSSLSLRHTSSPASIPPLFVNSSLFSLPAQPIDDERFAVRLGLAHGPLVSPTKTEPPWWRRARYPVFVVRRSLAPGEETGVVAGGVADADAMKDAPRPDAADRSCGHQVAARRAPRALEAARRRRTQPGRCPRLDEPTSPSGP